MVVGFLEFLIVLVIVGEFGLLVTIALADDVASNGRGGTIRRLLEGWNTSLVQDPMRWLGGGVLVISVALVCLIALVAKLKAPERRRPF